MLKHVLGEGRVYQLISRPQCEHLVVGCLAQWYPGSALKVSWDLLLSRLAHTGGLTSNPPRVSYRLKWKSLWLAHVKSSWFHCLGFSSGNIDKFMHI